MKKFLLLLLFVAFAGFQLTAQSSGKLKFSVTTASNNGNYAPRKELNTTTIGSIKNNVTFGLKNFVVEGINLASISCSKFLQKSSQLQKISINSNSKFLFMGACFLSYTPLSSHFFDYLYQRYH